MAVGWGSVGWGGGPGGGEMTLCHSAVRSTQISWPWPASRVFHGGCGYCLRSSVSDLENAITTSSAPWSMECWGSWLSWLLTTPA